jgi:hypothetical protein
MPDNENFEWENDTAECIGTSLYQMDLHSILKNHNLLYDDSGKCQGRITYYPSLADSGENIIHYSLPAKLFTLLDVLSEKENIDHSDLIRRAIVHGCAIYEEKFGAAVNDAYGRRQDDILNGNDDTDAFDDSCKVEMDCGKESIRICPHLFSILNKYRRRSGICREKFVGYLILYSLETHTYVTGKRKLQIEEIIKQIEGKLSRRLNNIS